MIVVTQKKKKTDPAQGTSLWAYEGPMAHENALIKEIRELSKMRPKSNNKRKNTKGLENKVQTTP